MQNIIKIFLGIVLAAMPALAAQAQEIPVETLFKKAEFGSIQLSPNGKLLAAVVPVKGRFNLAIMDMDKRSLTRLTGLDETDVAGYFWIGNDRLVFSTADQQGFESRGDGGLYAINVDGSNPRELSKPFRASLAEGRFIIQIGRAHV